MSFGERRRAVRKLGSSLDVERHQHPVWIKKPRFDSESTRLFVANVIVELLRNKNVYEASVLRFGSGGALGAAR
jgi:hypothetical protein